MPSRELPALSPLRDGRRRLRHLRQSGQRHIRQDLPGYGEPVMTRLEPALEAVRLGASDSAFAVIAAITALLCLVSAAIAWSSVTNVPAQNTVNPDG
jgi:hypothetical protein